VYSLDDLAKRHLGASTAALLPGWKAPELSLGLFA